MGEHQKHGRPYRMRMTEAVILTNFKSVLLQLKYLAALMWWSAASSARRYSASYARRVASFLPQKITTKFGSALCPILDPIHHKRRLKKQIYLPSYSFFRSSTVVPLRPSKSSPLTLTSKPPGETTKRPNNLSHQASLQQLQFPLEPY
jgi:hypothetical protein